MASKRTSASDKAQHARYQAQQVWKTNRKARLETAQIAQPNNLQIGKAIQNISYRRKIPGSKMWGHADKAMASLIKVFCGFCDKNVFHANKDLRESAWANIRAKSTLPRKPGHTKGMFSLASRAHNKGVLVWGQ